MRNVLTALKESREVARLRAAAAALVGPGAEADVVHVVETGTGQGPAGTEVETAVERLRARGIVAWGHVDAVRDGGVAERLAERARATGAEIVVMGSRGLGQPGGLVGHSVSHALLAVRRGRHPRVLLVAGPGCRCGRCAQRHRAQLGCGPDRARHPASRPVGGTGRGQHVARGPAAQRAAGPDRRPARTASSLTISLQRRTAARPGTGRTSGPVRRIARRASRR